MSTGMARLSAIAELLLVVLSASSPFPWRCRWLSWKLLSVDYVVQSLLVTQQVYWQSTVRQSCVWPSLAVSTIVITVQLIDVDKNKLKPRSHRKTSTELELLGPCIYCYFGFSPAMKMYKRNMNISSLFYINSEKLKIDLRWRSRDAS